MKRCPECGSWGVRCASEKAVDDCCCARCATVRAERLEKENAELRDEIELLEVELHNARDWLSQRA